MTSGAAPSRAPRSTPRSAPWSILARPTPSELHHARELAEVVLADAALALLLGALGHEHRTLHEPHERDPPTLRHARRLARRIDELRVELQRYRDAVLFDEESEAELPF